MKVSVRVRVRGDSVHPRVCCACLSLPIFPSTPVYAIGQVDSLGNFTSKRPRRIRDPTLAGGEGGSQCDQWGTPGRRLEVVAMVWSRWMVGCVVGRLVKLEVNVWMILMVRVMM